MASTSPARLGFTQLAVERMRPPATGRKTYWDRVLPGFGLHVYAPRPGARDGRKTWIAMYRVEGKSVMETLGTLAQIPTVAAAREMARTSIMRAKAGGHPVEEKRAERERRAAEKAAAEAAAREAVEGRFAQVAERFLTERSRAEGWSASYAYEVRRIFERDVLPRWGDRPIREISKGDVLELVNDKAGRRERSRKGREDGAAVQAGKMLTRLKTFFGWAMDNDLVAADPTAGVRKPAKEGDRDRVLSEAEIVAFWRGCEATGWPFGPIFRLLLLTAQRLGEVAGMRWSELDLDRRLWTIPRERTKSNRAHVVHLSELAIEILDGLPRLRGDLVFPSRVGTLLNSFSKPKARLDAAMAAQAGGPLAPWTLHDLRRTAATVMAERLAVRAEVADRILNHSAKRAGTVAKVYNRASYLDERQAALAALGRFVAGLVRPGGNGNVVLLRPVG